MKLSRQVNPNAIPSITSALVLDHIIDTFPNGVPRLGIFLIITWSKNTSS